MKIVIIKQPEMKDQISVPSHQTVLVNKTTDFVWVRSGGSLRDKSFYLHSDYEWILGEDDTRSQVLMPLKKE